MVNKGKTTHSAIPPLVTAVLLLLGLAVFLVPAVLDGIINPGTAGSITLAVCLTAYAVVTILSVGRFSLFSLSVLFAGLLFYTGSVTCYVFGLSPLNLLPGDLWACSWRLYPAQRSHGLAMLVLGILMIIFAARALIASRRRTHVEKVLEVVLLGMGTIQSVAGILALLLR